MINAKANNGAILVVEDDSLILDVFQDYLSDRFNLIFTTCGAMAMERLSNQYLHIDIILLDYNLPDISGIEVLKQIKKLRPSLPVIMITGYGNEQIAVDAFRHGVREYIKKPFTRLELIEKIEFCLSVKKVDNLLPRRVLTLTTESGSPDRLSSITQDGRIQRAVRYIHDNYASNLSLTRVAGVACMSKYHFSRTFKKTLGCTYQDYLNEMRINMAIDMLSEGTRSVTDVAFSLGYSELTHFARVFKKRTGRTPSSYRNGLVKHTAF